MRPKGTPSTKTLDALARLGERIRLARVRRRVTSALLAERIGVSHATMTAIERGAPGVAAGHYASALFCLGLLADLERVARAVPDRFRPQAVRALREAGLSAAAEDLDREDP